MGRLAANLFCPSEPSLHEESTLSIPAGAFCRKQNGESRMLVGKEATSYAVAETVARVFAATHGVPWDQVEVISA